MLPARRRRGPAAATRGRGACFDAEKAQSAASVTTGFCMLGHPPAIQPRRRAWIAIAAALAALAAASLLATGPATAPAAAAAQGRPNIVLLLTDDQENGSMRVMKLVNKEMKRKGVTFKRYYTNFPLCCPSRATLLTGEYAHNHKVLSNKAPDGGYGVFNELHGDDYLPIWLQRAGYKTSYIGKYLNEYAEPDEYGTLPRDVPHGWDDWHVLAPSKAEYFGYTLNENGHLHDYKNGAGQYSTTVFTTKAKRFIRHSAARPGPFFLQLGYAAPHGGGGGSPGVSCNRGAVPDPQDLGALKGLKKSLLPPSFNEADVTDKPSPVANNDPLTPGQVSDTLRKRRCAWESLLAVDRSVEAILAQLEKVGELRKTYVIFTSDNGFIRGEHRIRSQKRYIYEESAKVPFIVRGPGVARGETSKDVVSNADVVPTILQISGATAGNPLDGIPLLDDFANPKLEHGRAILHEAYAGQAILGVRTSRYLYTEWDTGVPLVPERELYDTYADPYELNNLARDPAYAPIVNQLANELDALESCRADNCHVGETAQLTFANAGVGAKGCALEPVVARLTGPDEATMTSVEFRVGSSLAGVDTVAPFEVTLPYKALLAELPRAATVLGRAVFADGRRVAVTANVRACK
jgi:N-acetylglucosamine-6-sulfatase